MKNSSYFNLCPRVIRMFPVLLSHSVYESLFVFLHWAETQNWTEPSRLRIRCSPAKLFRLETNTGIAPVMSGFAIHRLTTWLIRLMCPHQVLPLGLPIKSRLLCYLSYEGISVGHAGSDPAIWMYKIHVIAISPMTNLCGRCRIRTYDPIRVLL